MRTTRTTIATTMLATALLACGKESSESATGVTAPQPSAQAPAAQTAEAPRPPKPESARTVADVAIGSPDHTTLVAALKAADLVTALDSPGGVYTVFAPTNAAFDKLPAGTVEGLMKPEKKADLKAVLQHHATVPVLQAKDLHDGQVLTMADGTKVTIHVKNGRILVDDANVTASVHAMNGVVHVIDKVLVPPAK